MRIAKRVGLTIAILLGASTAALPGVAAASPDWAREARSAQAPNGYVEFCRTSPEQCVARGRKAAEPLTEARWAELNETNTLVNLVISPLTDLEQYATDEVWTLPGSFGDCEDYALLKRKWLMERGWPTSALLISVVFDEVGEGHAVLVAHTDRGDFVLDNKTDEIRSWRDTPYRFVKRQSVSDPNKWVAVSPAPAVDATAAPSGRSGLRGRLN